VHSQPDEHNKAAQIGKDARIIVHNRKDAHLLASFSLLKGGLVERIAAVVQRLVHFYARRKAKLSIMDNNIGLIGAGHCCAGMIGFCKINQFNGKRQLPLLLTEQYACAVLAICMRDYYRLWHRFENNMRSVIFFCCAFNAKSHAAQINFILFLRRAFAQGHKLRHAFICFAAFFWGRQETYEAQIMTALTTRTGTPASALCYGCMQFGGTADRQSSQAMYDASRAAGVNFFDTAYIYTEGLSETWLGEMVRDEVEDLLIATKADFFGGNSRDSILSSFDKSRARLGLDAVDILYLHRWSDQTPLEESLETLAQLQSEGKIRYIGLSNFAAWQVMKAQAVAARLGTRIDILQPMYSLLKRQAEVEILPMAAAEGLAVAPYSPLGGGVLTGKYINGATGRLTETPKYAVRYGQDWMHRTAADLVALAAEQGQDSATLAVAWAARHPAVSAPIISARNTAQLAPSLAALDLTLSDAEYDRITALSQSPPPATDRLEEAVS